MGSVSDNGIQFPGHNFKQLALKYRFRCVIASPHYPSCNELVENNVKIIKHTLKQAEDPDPSVEMLKYRAAPVKHGLLPADILSSRKLEERGRRGKTKISVGADPTP